MPCKSTALLKNSHFIVGETCSQLKSEFPLPPGPGGKRTSESNYSGTPLHRRLLNTDTHTMDSLICTNSEKARISLLKKTCFIQTPG